MKMYSAIEYLCIDIANHFGLDKDNFEPRIQWVKDNYANLEDLTEQADVVPLYVKAVMALRAAVRGEAIGHPVALDACCSGLQIMSAVTGCVAGASLTGLVDPDNRVDAYKLITDAMNRQPGISITIPRSKAKNAVMTAFYGSKRQPKIIFGDGTPELEAFFKTMGEECPGAWTLLHELLDSWNSNELEHSWELPDGYQVNVKVMEKVSKRIEVDELSHSTFTYEFLVNQGKKKGKSNAANVIHSIDAYVLRTMQRKCNYDALSTSWLKEASDVILQTRMYGSKPTENLDSPARAYYEKFKIVDLGLANKLNLQELQSLSNEHLMKLNQMVKDLITNHKPFELITVHDAFAAQANNCNWVRYHYKETLADLADSDIIGVILSKLYKSSGTYDKLSNNLGDIIRNSNYALS